mmetsp:Transcript_19661/g.42739  ORF Transcript_19661/g.42739 Transcript_19661/m.42739 type:complete len:432 (+) Transcript_19661:306-1601(+)
MSSLRGVEEVTNTNTSSVTRRRTVGTPKTNVDEAAASIHFIDYTPPPPTPLPPPPKYKLWLVVLVLAYIIVWLGYYAGIIKGLSASGWINDQAALFIFLGLVVLILIFAMTELTVYCCRVTVRGTTYGLGSWLKRPRIQWVHQYPDNWVVETLGCVITVLEDGFQMFNPPSRQADSGCVNHTSETKYYEHEPDVERGHEVTLRIEHRIKPNKWEKYCAWRAQIHKLVLHEQGFISVTQEDAVDLESGELQVIYVKFTSITQLNAWMSSPIRNNMLTKLRPLLLAPEVDQLRKDRDLPDTFTDLLTQQGEGVPTLLPKKWKVWWLSTIGLYCVIFVRNFILPHYLSRWGLDSAPVSLTLFVQIVIAFFFNAYVITPFLLMIFSEWIRRKENEQDTKKPWKTLNDGFSGIWPKVVIVASYCGGCAIAWALKSR